MREENNGVTFFFFSRWVLAEQCNIPKLDQTRDAWWAEEESWPAAYPNYLMIIKVAAVARNVR